MNIVLLCVITSLIIVTQGIQVDLSTTEDDLISECAPGALNIGNCPSKCRHGHVCEDSDCPYDGCEKGWWGRQCEYPLECLIPGDNGEHYRGTWNTTVKGETCRPWALLSYAGGTAFTPTDGANHSYCRHITGDPRPNVWCYTGKHGGTNLNTCSVPMCSEQCPTPNLTSDYVVVNQPREGFAVGTKLKISCKTGYKTKIHNISCGDNKQWTSPARCQVLECLLPGDNGTHYRGTQNTSSDGTACLPWNITHPPGEQFKIPIDGTKHNFCRHVPGFSMSGTWCHATYQGTGRKPCSIPTCSEYCSPPDLQHTPLAVGILNTRLHTGIVLNLDCKAGYWKNGSAAITCELDGQWSDFPSGICAECPEDRYGVACSGKCDCIEQYTVDCNRENGTCHCIQGRRGIDCSLDVNECQADVGICGDNSNCTYTEGSYTCVCHQGYTKTSGYCQAINCSELNPIHVHSSIQDEKDSYKYTDVVNVDCDLGYKTENGTSVTYLSCDTNGQWNGSVPFCNAICDHPTMHPNSRIRHNRTTFTLNDTTEIECDEGYKIIGQSRFICQDNRSWNGTMPKCIAICKPPLLDRNSRLLKNRTKYILHDAIEIECVDGFEVEGESRFICQNDRNWNGKMPRCRPKTERHDITKRIMTALIGTTSGLAVILIVVTVAFIFTYSRYRRRERNRPTCASTNEVELANIHQYESISQYEVIIHELREPQSIYNQLTPP